MRAARPRQLRVHQRLLQVSALSQAVLIRRALALFALAVAGGAGAAQPPPGYVGSERCGACHTRAFEAWSRSHHREAMDVADDRSVLGDFEDEELVADGEVSRFRRDGDRYVVDTTGANGEMQSFTVTHTFGVAPLQQYLVTFPDGRRQALRASWDTRPAGEGGQRWFHQYPGERIDADDELHWTGRNQNWNYMCADCHAVDVRKQYDAATDRYATTWAEMTVGCEACHGPGADHVAAAHGAAAQGPSPGTDADADSAEHDLDYGFPTSAAGQIEICARCHARRSIIAEGFTPGDRLLDHYLPALLDEGLYHPDGQILDEVYVYGSFLQSRMHQAGVRCSDCHDPHSASLRLPGDATCLQCHQAAPPGRFPTLRAGDYADPQHHFHPPDSEGARCIACHMPARTYMVVDERHDHGFRIPRPDLTLDIGTPNACNDCHTDRDARWAADFLAGRRNGAPAPEHFGPALAAGRRRAPGADAGLIRIAGSSSMPAIVRGTALSLLANDDTRSLTTLRQGLEAQQPLVQVGALRGTRGLPLQARWQLASPLLDAPLRALRAEAALTLADAARMPLSSGDRQRLERAVQEYEDTQRLNAERPEALTNIGTIRARSGEVAPAEQAFRQALALDPGWVPAIVNLVDLYRASGRDAEGEPLLRDGLRRLPESADLQLAQGLWLVRNGQRDAALDPLRRAAELAPDRPRPAYVFGVALHSAGRTDRALRVLASAHERFPGDPDILAALISLHQERGDLEGALRYTEALLAIRPEDERLRQFREQLRQLLQWSTSTRPQT